MKNIAVRTIHLVPHTHWDREWYQPFQVFRVKLVQLIDNLLDMMISNAEIKYFTLDGQTIILEDYLEIRPERETDLRALVESGRLLIGPWHVLPDEFLVSPESLIRNLIRGDQVASRFGNKMHVGYIPDPFGHIGQMPQILRGFGIQDACLERGLDIHPVEFWWQAPDGSRVLMAYLRGSYGHAGRLPMEDAEQFTSEVLQLSASLEEYSNASHILLMNGDDHTQPSPLIYQRVLDANASLNEHKLIISNLPQYLSALHTELDQHDSLPVVTGELRSSMRWHLLPGVLSTRVWIKQRNHECETLLEKWAEPFTLFASVVESSSSNSIDLKTELQTGNNALSGQDAFLRRAWRLLLECHPHDSICGCSIDQVHKEMRSRFDQVEQIGEEILRLNLESIAGRVDTQPPNIQNPLSSIVVFNAQPFAVSGVTSLQVTLPKAVEAFQLVSETGDVIPHLLGEEQNREIATLVLDRERFQLLLAAIQTDSLTQSGPLKGMVLQDADSTYRDHTFFAYLSLAPLGDHNPAAFMKAASFATEALSNPSINRFIIQVSIRFTRLTFLASNVPGIGYRTYWIVPVESQTPSAPVQSQAEPVIENEYFHVEFSPSDGTFTLIDRLNQKSYAGLNRFVDGGDCGDLYNYAPPENDFYVDQVEILHVDVQQSTVEQSITAHLRINVPVSLTDDRKGRRAEVSPLNVITTLSLRPGIPRLDIKTEVNNTARDHRLRVHFPAAIQVEEADYDGHFEVVRRKLSIPPYDDSWVEQPRPEKPQRLFCDISDGETGLMIANRGLREVQVSPLNGEGKTDIALTLLRCTGWLSRDDFSTRSGHAGPGLPTPGAQMEGDWTFHYAVIPHSGHWEKAFQQAHAFNTPLRAVLTTIHTGQTPSSQQFVESSTREFIISTIKPAESGRGWVLRGYNPLNHPIQVRIRLSFPFATVARASMDEKPVSLLAHEEAHAIEFESRAGEIVTLYFEN